MRRFFLLIITVSQLFGGLIALAQFDSIAGQAPDSAASIGDKLSIAGTILIHLFGLIGSILIWTGARTGLWLSLTHQLLIVPVIFIPGGFYWVTGDMVSAVVAAVFNADGAVTFGAALNLNTASPVESLSPSTGAAYYGVDVFALICALYLNRLRRDEA